MYESLLSSWKKIYIRVITRMFRVITRIFRVITRMFRVITRMFRVITRIFRVITRMFRVITRIFRVITRMFRVITRIFRVITRMFRVITRIFRVITRMFRVITRIFRVITRMFRVITRIFRVITRILDIMRVAVDCYCSLSSRWEIVSSKLYLKGRKVKYVYIQCTCTRWHCFPEHLNHSIRERLLVSTSMGCWHWCHFVKSIKWDNSQGYERKVGVHDCRRG